MKKTLCLILTALLMLTFTSCSGGIKGDEAKETVNNFLQVAEEKIGIRRKNIFIPSALRMFKSSFLPWKQRKNLIFQR